MHTKFKKSSCSFKKIAEKNRQDGKYKKRKLETWSEKVIDTLINCFQSQELLWNVTSGNYKEKNKKSLALEEVDMLVQEYYINRYDYKSMD